MQELTTLKLIERISTLLRAEQRKKYSALGLQPLHIQTLDYLASCNRFSTRTRSQRTQKNTGAGPELRIKKDNSRV